MPGTGKYFDIKRSIVLGFTSTPRSILGQVSKDGKDHRMSAMAVPEQRVPLWHVPHLAASFRMMGGALLASLVALALAGVFGWFSAGLHGLASAALGALTVIAFLGGGTPVQLAAMGQGSHQAVGLVLIGYVSRVAMLGLVLGALGPGRSHWDPDVNSVVVGVVLTSLAWISGLVIAHSRIRIPVFDTEYRAPARDGD